MDFRFSTLHKTNPVDLTVIEVTQNEEGLHEVTQNEVIQTSTPAQPESQQSPTITASMLTARNLRLQCTIKNCNRARSLGRSQCFKCENVTNTQLATQPDATQLSHETDIETAAEVSLPKRNYFRYGLGHTDGGRRKITSKGKCGKQTTLKDVEGWTFQRLCSHGAR